MIRNPILPGFNPDPSILRVGDDYYIATSTFEWYPGVQIHHSRDLVNWRLLTRPLRRASQLNMLGDPDSCGVWAPCLTYSDGLFWLIYTDVKRYGRTTVGGASGASLRDFHNYLVTCSDHRRRVVRSGVPEQQRLRSVAVPRRRRAQVPGEPALGPSPGSQPLRRHRAAGVLADAAQADRRAQEHLQGHGHRLHRSAASLQAQWLLLPDHRRGRHGLGPRDDHGAFTLADRTVRAASRQVHHHGAGSSRCAAAARRSRRPGGNAGGRYLRRLSMRTSAAQPRPLRAGPRDRDPEDGLGQR